MNNQQTNGAVAKIELLKKLRQVRQFSERPVPQNVIRDILEVARWTGSGMNRQPWEFLVIRKPEILKELAAAEGGGSHLPGANFAIIVIMAGEMKEIETYDEARLTERMMLAAEAHGVGAGIWWFKDGGSAAKRLLGIPDEKQVRTAVSFGYVSEEAAAKPKKTDARKPLAQLVHEEKY